MSWRQWTILVLWFAAVLSIAGQTSNVTQCISSFNWSLNSFNQTPCYVSAELESLCGVPTSVDMIPPGNHYLGPSVVEADPCRCNSVTYSLISACGGCQNRAFINWTMWTANCPAFSVATYPKPIPSNVVVPNWAYLNVSQTNNTFDVEAAQNASGVSSTSISSPATPLPTTTTTTTPGTSTSTGKQSNAGAIAGGVVGGLVLLAAIALVGFWLFLRKKRRNAIQEDIPFDSRALVSGHSTGMTQTSKSPLHGSSALSSQSIYTSDMSAFPGSPLTTSGVFTTIPPSRRSLESVSLSVVQLGGGQTNGIGPGQRGYAGMPEI